MKIGLMGCEFTSPNKGCEALAYSIVSIINKLNISDNNITIYNFSGTELGNITEEFSTIQFINIKPKIKDLSFKYFRSLCKCDYIFDATMGDSFSDIYSEKYFRGLMRHKKIAELFCKNYILLPQTYGPFYSEKSEKIAVSVLKKAKKIYCRDQISHDLLKSKFNLCDTELVTDMAFFLPYYKEKYKLDSKKIKIGINISGLLYNGGFNSSNQFDLKINYKELIKKILIYFSNNDNIEVHIIPHVIDLSNKASDDDYKISELLKKEYSNIVLAPIFNNPIEAKSYISNMDIFIGSRMHSTIAAFSSGVVTIPISYSRKFEGLFNSLNYNYVINGKTTDTEDAFNKVIEYVSNPKKLKEKQIKSQKIIEKSKNKFINCLKDDLNNK